MEPKALVAECVAAMIHGQRGEVTVKMPGSGSDDQPGPRSVAAVSGNRRRARE